MNIKKLFIIASITAQLSTILHAYSQDAYNAAFHAFDVKFNSAAAKTNTYKQSAAFISSHGDAYSVTECSGISNTLGTPEAKAVGIYLAKGTIAQTKASFPSADGLAGSNMAYGNMYAAIAAAPDTLPVNTPATSSAAQLSDVVNVPANWTAAFAAFGGAQGVYDKTATQKTMPASLPANSAAYKDAQVIVQYLGATPTVKGDMSGVLNSVDKTNLDAAFTAANVQRASAPTQTAADINAAALKAQIESAKVLYNQYLTTQGKPALYVAQ